MTDDLYERYKEALRTGHVAVLRGFFEAAIEAYETAAAIAPTRALPHTSLGGVYLRMGRVDDALAEYAAAVARAPLDDGALLGQAEALTAVGRLGDAASALDRVAHLQEKAGRLPEAADTLRRALELDDAPERVRRQRSLIRQIRLSAGDREAENALARALRLPDAMMPNRAMSSRVEDLTGGQAARPRPDVAVPGPATALPEVAALPEAALPAAARPEVAESSVEGAEPAAEPPAVGVAAVEPSAGVAEPDTATDVEPIAITIEPDTAPVESAAAAGAIDVGEARQPDAGSDRVGATALTAAGDLSAHAQEPVGVPIETQQPAASDLLAAAEAAEAQGNADDARRLRIEAARGYAREGRFDAGLDTAHTLVLHDPGDIDGHLVLVELYVSRRWESLAADKLILLGRMAELADDADARVRVCAAASAAFPGNARLASLCS